MELIPDEIYFLNSSAGWVFKFERYESDPNYQDEVSVISSHLIYPKDKEYKQNSNLCYITSKIEHATAEQRTHLQACIDAGQYVEPPKSLSYDIF